MPSASRFEHSGAPALPQEMRELQRRIAMLSPAERRSLTEAFDRVVAMFNRRVLLLDMIQDSLSDFRHRLHCMSFDLESTRRERDQLRAQLDDFGDPESSGHFFG